MVDDPLPDGYRLGLRVLRLGEQDPRSLLDRPGLAPLAILADSSRMSPEEIFRQALQHVRVLPEDQQEAALLALQTLGTSILPADIMQGIEEEAMLNEAEILEGFQRSSAVQKIVHDAETRSREEGREEGREEVYADMLRARFGEQADVAAVADRLADLPRALAVRAVLAASTIDDVLPRP